MELHYKQHDIVKAIKDKLISDGFPLTNKTLNISFSMGRGNNGLAAVLAIDDVEIPGFTDSIPVPTTAVTLPVSAAGEDPQETATAPATMKEVAQSGVTTLEMKTKLATVASDVAEAKAAAPEVVAQVASIADEAAPVETQAVAAATMAPATSTKSLFGNTPAA